MQRGRAELTLRGARRCSRAGDRELRLDAAERGLGSCSGAGRAFLMYVRISLLWCLLYFLLTSDSRAGLLRAFICGLSTTLAWLRCSCIGIAPGAKPNAEARPSSVRRRTRIAVQGAFCAGPRWSSENSGPNFARIRTGHQPTKHPFKQPPPTAPTLPIATTRHRHAYHPCTTAPIHAGQ